MRARLFIVACFVIFSMSDSFAQNDKNWAVGVRVGEPIGLNVRKYFDYGSKNFDLNVGTYGMLWGNKRSYQKAEYYNQAGGMVQGIFHWNKQLGAREKTQIYYGFGGQVNSRKTVPPVGNNIALRQVSFGGVINTGLEFTLSNEDLSFFTDFGVYVQLVPKPLFSAINAGLGVRYNIFK